MSSSPVTTRLSKPVGDDQIHAWAIEYFRTRNKNRVHQFVLNEFERANISQATLARRLGRRPEVISRMLGAPGNWTLDSVSDLLFAICGGEASYTLSLPLENPTRNYQHQDENMETRGGPFFYEPPSNSNLTSAESWNQDSKQPNPAYLKEKEAV